MYHSYCHCEGAAAPSRAGCRATEAISRSSAKQPAQGIPPALAGDCFASCGQSIALPLHTARNDRGGGKDAEEAAPALAGDCFASCGQSIALPLHTARNDRGGGKDAEEAAPALAGDCFASCGQSIALPLHTARNDR
ncbi:hypothetical protein A6A03_10880 [Chloroflexus islandicus]|uniref:Uncharacterized protein n=1 Tax=Chloroflexus islandicus TaxID=1707952 RepID=A0A178ME74_9CHLR|nr:hypothetical protein A6A03_10880 [Chloroflexus islandicus]